MPLRVLSGGLGLTPTAVARFCREAEPAAKLYRTNIVPFYAIGEEDGTHHYALESIEGLSLDVVIQQMGCAPAAGRRSRWAWGFLLSPRLRGLRPVPRMGFRERQRPM